MRINFDMFPLLFSLSMVTIRDGGSNLIKGDVRDIISVEISRFVLEDFLGMNKTVRDELISIIGERFRILQAELEVS